MSTLVLTASADRSCAGTTRLRRMVAAIARFAAGRRAEAAKRATLQALLRMDAHRLEDIGLTALDVIDAIETRR